MEEKKKTEAGNAEDTKDRVHSFHRVYTITLLRDLTVQPPKIIITSGAHDQLELAPHLLQLCHWINTPAVDKLIYVDLTDHFNSQQNETRPNWAR